MRSKGGGRSLCAKILHGKGQPLPTILAWSVSGLSSAVEPPWTRPWTRVCDPTIQPYVNDVSRFFIPRCFTPGKQRFDNRQLFRIALNINPTHHLSKPSKLTLKSPANTDSQFGWRTRHDQISVRLIKLPSFKGKTAHSSRR